MQRIIIIKKRLPYLIIGLVGFIIFAAFLVEKQISDRLLETSRELENKAEKVAARLTERLSQICERVNLIALNPLIQNGNSQVVFDLLVKMTSNSSLHEALLVLDDDGSLIAENQAGWYKYYLENEDSLIKSGGNLICADTIDQTKDYIFTSLQYITSGNRMRQVVAFANLRAIAEEALLGNYGEMISIFTENNTEIVLVAGHPSTKPPSFPIMIQIAKWFLQKKAAVLLQASAVVTKREWSVTVTKSLQSFLNESVQAAFSGFRFYLLLLFPVFILLVLVILAVNHSRSHFQELSVRDGLTDLFNHRFFQTKLRALLEQGRIHKISLAMLDIDNFKRFNDTHGHPVGDKILQKIAAILRENIRTSDIAARYGGEEFVLILPGSDLKEAMLVLERIRKAIKLECGTTVSIGVSSFPEHATSAEGLIERADQALYQAKKLSKDRVECFEDLKS